MKRCTAWNARNKPALASNKYSYTYVNPPRMTRRMTEARYEGGTGAEVEGTIEAGNDDSSCFSLYAQWGKKERGKKKDEMNDEFPQRKIRKAREVSHSLAPSVSVPRRFTSPSRCSTICTGVFTCQLASVLLLLTPTAVVNTAP